MKKKLIIKLDGEKFDVEIVEVTSQKIGVIVNGRLHKVEIDDLPDLAKDFEVDAVVTKIPSEQLTPVVPQKPIAQSGQITAPIPGEIVEIKVKVGDNISIGQEVVVLEAMKMKNKIRAAHPGVVAGIEVEKGDSVEYGQVLVQLEEE